VWLKKAPLQKLHISSKRHYSFVRHFQRLLGSKFAINGISFVQCYESLHKWATFGFQCVISGECASVTSVSKTAAY